MSEKEYLDADFEVIGMVNRKAGPGGELPRKALSFIPKDRAERVEKLDLRIQKLQNVMPYICATAWILVFLLIGRAI